jgi:phage gp36-like protein
MAYSTLAQVQIAVGGLANLVQLADLEEANTLDSGALAVIDAAIAEADGHIDSYVAHRSKVPLVTTPIVISSMSARWAARILRKNRYKGQPMVDDQEAERIDIAWLDGVSKGVISLGVDPEPLAATIVIDKAAPRDPSLFVSRRRMKDFI